MDDSDFVMVKNSEGRSEVWLQENLIGGVGLPAVRIAVFEVKEWNAENPFAYWAHIFSTGTGIVDLVVVDENGLINDDPQPGQMVEVWAVDRRQG